MKIHIIGGPGSGKTYLAEIRKLLIPYSDKVIAKANLCLRGGEFCEK
ncbi:MAG: hypothetical protein IJ112_06595 [Oscillospiraceae bacterium]|nr:hypothetical protein [Oscillospiraceae bacterium]